jgi:hypothetical protein
MDKNVAALLRNDTKTVAVRFYNDRDERSYSREQKISLNLGMQIGDEQELGNKSYTYVTNLSFEVGELAVVFVSGIPKVVKVVEVHPSCQIEPNENIKYKWITARVDLDEAVENERKNTEIETVIAKSYKRNLKSQFKSLLLADVTPEDQQVLLSCLGE